MITVKWLDKRAMDAIEHHQRTRELNSRIFLRNHVDDNIKSCDNDRNETGVMKNDTH